MSNIQTYLEKMRSARYGKDVRQSICNAIEEIDSVADTAQDSATKSAMLASEYAATAGGYMESTKISEESAKASAASAEESAKQAMASVPGNYTEFVESTNGHIKNTSNPHGVTKAQVGLGNVPNVATNDQTPTYTSATILEALTSGEKLSTAFGKIAKAVADFITHLKNTSNPHSVTKTQVGLENVNNTADSDKPVSTAQKTAIDAVQTNLNTHTANKNNPHGVTKAQVGLGNVPNVATNDQTPTFTVASTRANIVSGEKFSVILGKIMKFFADLKTVAFSGSYADLSNKPRITSKQIKYQYLPATKTSYAVSLGDYDFYTWTINIGGVFRNSITISPELAKDPSIIHQVDFVTSGTPYWAAFQYVNDTTINMWTNYTSTVIGYIYGYKLS